MDAAIRVIALSNGLLLLAVVVACSERVRLYSEDGDPILVYSCGQLESKIRSTDHEATVREYATRIAKHASARGDQESVRQLTAAYQSDHLGSLEPLVVGYLCEHGQVEKEVRVAVFPETGSAARNFALLQLTLEPPYEAEPGIRLTDHRGSVVVLDVFGTWCPPCLEKYPSMAKVAADYKDKGVKFFGILLNDSPRRAAKWLERNGGLAYPFLIEDGSNVERDWALVGAPMMYVIDQQGFIAGRCTGCQAGWLGPDSLPLFLDSLVHAESQAQ